MVVVFYKFKNAVGHETIPLDGSSISVATLKRKILESMHLNRDIDFELVVTNSKTHEGWLMFNLKFKESQLNSLNLRCYLLVLLLYSWPCNMVLNKIVYG